MKRWIANWIRRVNLIFLLGVWAAASVQNVQAAEQEPRVLRVPFPQVTGMTETTPDGRRQGLVVDYLNEIAKYTGWEYEYIDTDGDSMVKEFLEGKYDLMGGNYYSPGFEELFAYPDYNIGYSKSVLMARKDDSSINSYDLRSLNGRRTSAGLRNTCPCTIWTVRSVPTVMSSSRKTGSSTPTWKTER